LFLHTYKRTELLLLLLVVVVVVVVVVVLVVVVVVVAVVVVTVVIVVVALSQVLKYLVYSYKSTAALWMLLLTYINWGFKSETLIPVWNITPRSHSSTGITIVCSTSYVSVSS